MACATSFVVRLIINEGITIPPSCAPRNRWTDAYTIVPDGKEVRLLPKQTAIVMRAFAGFFFFMSVSAAIAQQPAPASTQAPLTLTLLTDFDGAFAGGAGGVSLFGGEGGGSWQLACFYAWNALRGFLTSVG